MMMLVVLKQLFTLNLYMNNALSLVALEQLFSELCLNDNFGCV